MRAVVIRASGGPGVLELADVAVPTIGPQQIGIRMEAAAVNPVDVATRAGMFTEAGLLPAREAVGLGWDIAGVVDAVGEEVTAFAPGDRVTGMSDRLDVPLGTHAEYVVLDASAATLTPAGISSQEAATLPLNALTAKQSLDHLDLRPGRTLLVTGAAGAVGGFAVQLAAASGFRVIATAGEEDEELVGKLGAELFVPRGARLGEAVRELVPGGVDGAIDAAVLGVEALDAVRSGGAFAALVGGEEPPPLRGTRVFNQWVHADGRQLGRLAELARSGALTLRVAGELPLSRAADAYDQLAAGGLRGRTVLVP